MGSNPKNLATSSFAGRFQARVRWVQLPVILFATLCFRVTTLASRGELTHAFLRNSMSESLRSVSSFFTDRKFRIRGARASQNKIVIVAIDEASLANPNLG